MKNNYDFALCLSIHLRPVFCLFLHHLSFDCFLKNWANLGLFFIYFHLFKLTSLQFLQQINVKMLFPSSIWYRDSNSRPLEHELFMVFFNTDAQTNRRTDGWTHKLHTKRINPLPYTGKGGNFLYPIFSTSLICSDKCEKFHVHLVYGSGIRTHDLWNMSLPP